MIAQTRDDFSEAVSRINTGNASLNVPPLNVEAIREMASTPVLLAHLCVCLHDTDTSGVMLLMKDQGRWWGWYMYSITASVWRAMAKECAQELVNRGDGAARRWCLHAVRHGPHRRCQQHPGRRQERRRVRYLDGPGDHQDTGH